MQSLVAYAFIAACVAALVWSIADHIIRYSRTYNK
jgi:hypothetical protein